MASDLGPYKVASGELSSATKFNNLVQRVQDALNAIGDLSQMAWFSGQVVDPAQLKAGGAVSGQVMGYDGAAWGPSSSAAAGYVAKNITVAKNIINTTADSDLLNGAGPTIVINANEMVNGKTLFLTVWGDARQFSGSTVASPRWKLKIGGTTVIDSNVLPAASTSFTGRRPWTFRIEVHCEGATSHCAIRGDALFDGTGANTGQGFTTGIGSYRLDTNNCYYLLGYARPTIDWTTNKNLEFTVTLGTASTNHDVNCYGAKVLIF